MDAEADFVTFSPTTNFSLPSEMTSTEICSFGGLNDTKSIYDLLSDPSCRRLTLHRTKYIINLYVILFVVGLVINVLVVLRVGCKRRLQTTKKLFLANLAMADLLMIVFGIPATLFSTIFIPWIPGETICKAVSYIQGVSRLSSAFSLIALSMDRFRATYFRMYDVGLSKHTVLKISIYIWTIAAFLTLPYLFVFELVYLPETGALPYCQETWTYLEIREMYYILVQFTISFLIPSLVVTVFNYATWKNVPVQSLPNSGAHEEIRQGPTFEEIECRRSRRFVVLMTVLICTFFVCRLPFQLLDFKSKSSQYPDRNSWEFIAIAQLLVVLNSCLNPVIYALFSTKCLHILRSVFRILDWFGGRQVQRFTRRRRVNADQDEEINCETINMNELGLQERQHRDTADSKSEEDESCLVLDGSQEKRLTTRRRVYEDPDEEMDSETFHLNQLGVQEHRHQDTTSSSSEEGKSCLVLGVTIAQVHNEPSDSEDPDQSTAV